MRMKTKIFTLLFALLTGNVFATQDKSTLELRLQSVNTGYLGETSIFFDQNINPAYNSSQDAAMVFSDVPGVPAFFSYTSDNVMCSINGAGDLSVTEVVELGAQVDISGSYNITAYNIDNFDPTSIILLEDRELNVFTNLRTNFYNIRLDSGAIVSGRFFIHVSYPASFASVNAGCTNTNGVIKAIYDSSIQWNQIQLFDANNDPVPGGVMVNKGETDFGALSEGDYTLDFYYGTYIATRTFHLNGNQVIANIAVDSRAIFTGEQVTFNANATNATQYTWNFGDGTIITNVANPSLAYSQSGDYTVNLQCSNDSGCSVTAQFSVTVNIATATGVQDEGLKAISVYGYAMNVTVNMNGVTNNNSEVLVYNLLGQPVYDMPLNVQKETISLNGQANGYYLVSVKNAGEVNTTRVFLSR